jgi:hypothetical protein
LVIAKESLLPTCTRDAAEVILTQSGDRSRHWFPKGVLMNTKTAKIAASKHKTAQLIHRAADFVKIKDT